jgi:hypothetical protein
LGSELALGTAPSLSEISRKNMREPPLVSAGLDDACFAVEGVALRKLDEPGFAQITPVA